MPSRRIEEQLEALKNLRSANPAAAALALLRKSLQDRVNIIVAKAAQIAAEMQLAALFPDLATAFERLFENPLKTDPQCWGKNALAKALKDLGYAESGLFVRGARHVQLEPVWGGVADTAATLRGGCALALVQCGDITRESKLRVLVDSLTDPEPPVRSDAITALAQMDGEEAILLLRLKAKLGDKQPEVTGQVLDALLQLDGAESVPFVTSFLESKQDELREEAALALGASRLNAAIEALKDAWERQRTHEREPLLRAISSARTGEAIEFLLDLVRNAREPDALAALHALELHKDSGEICRHVTEAAANRTEPRIRDEVQARFVL